MAQRKKGDRPQLQEDPLVEALVPDPSQGPPNAAVLQGYLGKGTTERVWRLYLTPDLAAYVELPEDEILHSEKQPDDGTFVWVRKELRLTVHRLQAAQVQADFLSGPVADARLDPAVTAAGMTVLGGEEAARGSWRKTCFTCPPWWWRTPFASEVPACGGGPGLL